MNMPRVGGRSRRQDGLTRTSHSVCSPDAPRGGPYDGACAPGAVPRRRQCESPGPGEGCTSGPSPGAEESAHVWPRWCAAAPVSRLPLLGAGALTASPPAFLAYRGAPWWVLLLVALPGLGAGALVAVASAVIPQDSRDRLDWWRVSSTAVDDTLPQPPTPPGGAPARLAGGRTPDRDRGVE